MGFFDGFALDHIDVDTGVTLRVRHHDSGTGGAGSGGPGDTAAGLPVLLVHGHPRTHTTWHRLVPLLVDRHAVVCPDLRGYGRSSKPATDADHTPYAKRAMAADLVALMRSLGHDRFAVVGHDRGAYVAHRLAMDHPDVVAHLTILDSIAIGDALARADARFAAKWWHWFWLGQTAKPAEPAISADPITWYRLGPDTVDALGRENHADVVAAVRDPATVHAMCEDYRAGLGVDRATDDADRAAGRRVACPLLMLWATRDDMELLYGDPLEPWRAWADDVDGHVIDSGHHIAEDAPAELADALRAAWARLP